MTAETLPLTTNLPASDVHPGLSHGPRSTLLLLPRRARNDWDDVGVDIVPHLSLPRGQRAGRIAPQRFQVVVDVRQIGSPLRLELVHDFGNPQRQLGLLL